jgi:hypothetical protein
MHVRMIYDVLETVYVSRRSMYIGTLTSASSRACSAVAIVVLV